MASEDEGPLGIAIQAMVEEFGNGGEDVCASELVEACARAIKEGSRYILLEKKPYKSRKAGIFYRLVGLQ